MFVKYLFTNSAKVKGCYETHRTNLQRCSHLLPVIAAGENSAAGKDVTLQRCSHLMPEIAAGANSAAGKDVTLQRCSHLLPVIAAEENSASSFLQFLKMVIIACLFLSSCTPKPNQLVNTSHDAPVPFVLKYDRGPCFGKCPVYTFYLLQDHTALVYAKANLMDTSGWYYANPDQEDIVEILELIEPAEWWTTRLNNEPEIADLPHVSMTYRHPGGVRTISIQSKTTQSLENVFGKINHIVSNCSWKPTAIRPMEIEVSEPTNVIVQLKPGVDINEWMRRFENFGIQLVKKVSPNQQYYVVSKDPLRGASNDFLQYIKNDPDVVDAQWDKRLQKRD